jgi:hypothetical protein
MAQVYPRITNPFMPQGTPDKTNSPTPFYAPGEIGCAFNDQNLGGSYLRVLLDSGATSATSVGAVAAYQVAYWKDQKNAIVTNDKNQCDVGPTGAINRVAGIFQLAVSTAPGVTGTDGNPTQYVCDLVIQKRAYPVLANSALVGAFATVDTTANTARVVYTTGVNTAPVSQAIGTFASSTIGTPGPTGTAPVNVNIGFVD